MATELGAGYIELGIKYDDALKKIGSDLTGLERTSATAGTRIASNLSSGFRTASAEANKAGASATQAFSQGLTKGINDAFKGVSSNFGSFQGQANTAFSAVTSKAGMAALGVAGVGLAAVAVGKQLYDLGAQWDSIADGITIRTGKVGDELKSLTGIVGDVGKTTAASLGSIGDIVGRLTQSMPELARSGDVLRILASNLAHLDANGVTVDIRELVKTFHVFNVDAAHAVSTLDALNNASQKSGIPINDLLGSVSKGAAQFKQFGLGLSESTALLVIFEQAGLNTQTVITGLRTALGNIGGDDPEQKLSEIVTQIKALSDAGNEAAARNLAIDIFGTRQFAPFLDIIQSGTLDIAALSRVIDDNVMSLQEQQDATDDGAEGWQKLKNAASDALKPLADWIFSNANQPLLQMQGNLEKASDGLNKLATTPIDPNSALGRILTSGGAAIPGIPGTAGPLPPPTTRPAMPTTGLGPNFYKDWYKQQWGGSAAGPKAAAAPVLPIDATLPPGFGEIPELFSQESSFIDARHALEEKRARLNQLEADNTATAEQIQQAKNDVFTGERSFQSAERSLYDARQDMFEAEAKRIEDERKKAEAEFDKFQTSFSGGSLLDLLLYMVFQPKFNEIRQSIAGTSAGATGGGVSSLLPQHGVSSIGGGGVGGSPFAGGSASSAMTGGAVPAGLTGPQAAAYQAMIAAGYPPSEWGALKNILDKESGGGDPTAVNPSSGAFGMFQFLGHENDKYGQMGGYSSDPTQQSAAGLAYIKDKYGSPSAAWQFWQANNWYQSGGSIPGKGSGDTVPILGEPGEHMFNRADVSAMGGQQAVYAFRKALHMQDGGDVYGLPGGTDTGGYGNTPPGTVFPPWVWQLADQYGVKPSTYAGHQTTGAKGQIRSGPVTPNPQELNRGIDWVGSPEAMRNFAAAMAGSGGAEQVIFADDQGGIGYPFNADFSADYPKHRNHVHTRFSKSPLGGAVTGAPGASGLLPGIGGVPGLNPLQAMTGAAEAPATGKAEGKGRTEGYIPAGAGTSGQAGGSLVAGLFGMGADVVNFLIDQGVSMASMAASAALAGGTMGASAMAPGAGQAATAGLQIAADVAKKGVDYVAQLGGIWADAAAEIFLPFGVPRFLQTDPNAFMPRVSGLPTAQTTGEKATLGSQDAALAPGGPVQPGQLPGQQPVGAPVKPAESGGIQTSPVGSMVSGMLGSALGGGPAPGAGPGAPQKPAPYPGTTPQTAKPGGGVAGPPNIADELLKNLGIFDEGGWLDGVGVNTTGKPEPVLSHEQWANVEAIAGKPMGEFDSARSGANYDYRVMVSNVTVKDVNELQRQLSDRQKIQMMRHAGRPSLGGA